MKTKYCVNCKVPVEVTVKDIDKKCIHILHSHHDEKCKKHLLLVVNPISKVMFFKSRNISTGEVFISFEEKIALRQYNSIV
jgi:hypothetical protein